MTLLSTMCPCSAATVLQLPTLAMDKMWIWVHVGQHGHIVLYDSNQEVGEDAPNCTNKSSTFAA